MKTAIFASLIASAAAFAPVSQQKASTALSAGFESEVGAQAPLGFFDPLGVVKDADQEKFDRLRYVELKHGRIAMLAVVGFLTQQAGVRLPGNIAADGTTFASIPNGFKALEAIPKAGLFQIILFIFFMEVGVMRSNSDSNEFPGDFRNGYIDFVSHSCCGGVVR